MLDLLRKVGSPAWTGALKEYLASREELKHEITRKRNRARVPVTLLAHWLKAPRFLPEARTRSSNPSSSISVPPLPPGGVVLYIGDTENKFVHLETAGLSALGVTLDSAAKIPDVIVHDTSSQLASLSAYLSSNVCAGPDGAPSGIEGAVCWLQSGLVFVTAFETRRIMGASFHRLPGSLKSGSRNIPIT